MNETIVDNYIKNYPFAGSFWEIPSIILSYLILVLYIGPNFMKKREPIKFVKFLIPIYNLFQVFLNSWFIYETFFDTPLFNYVIKNVCGNNPEIDLEIRKKFVLYGYFWCMIKGTDLIDTIFFILMKKNNHVSFLHVYHHSTTMMISFVVFKYLRTEQNAIYAVINTGIHVIMYTYYFVTSLGFKTRFKKLVTILQLFQFICFTLMTAGLLICQTIPKYYCFSIYSLCQCVMYIYLFHKFYKRAYISKTNQD